MMVFVAHIAEQLQQEMKDVEKNFFSVAYVNGLTARSVLRAVRCDDCKTCLTSPMMLSTNVFIYFKEYKDNSL
jgi:hypothetical protein